MVKQWGGRMDAKMLFDGGQLAVQPTLLEPFKRGLGPNEYPRDIRWYGVDY